MLYLSIAEEISAIRFIASSLTVYGGLYFSLPIKISHHLYADIISYVAFDRTLARASPSATRAAACAPFGARSSASGNLAATPQVHLARGIPAANHEKHNTDAKMAQTGLTLLCHFYMRMYLTHNERIVPITAKVAQTGLTLLCQN